MTRILWHASRADIASPTVAGRTPGPHHANSGLGLFCATGPYDYLTNFGQVFHALTLREDARVLRWSVDELLQASMTTHLDDDEDPSLARARFEQQGRALAHDFDIIELVESDGHVEQVIVLHDGAIVSSLAYSAEAFAAQAVPRPVSGTQRRPGKGW